MRLKSEIRKSSNYNYFITRLPYVIWILVLNIFGLNIGHPFYCVILVMCLLKMYRVACIARTQPLHAYVNDIVTTTTVDDLFTVNGELMIIRSCAWASDSRNDDGPCAINTPANIRIEHCSTCDQDLCNGVTNAGAIGFLTAVAAVAAKLVANMFWKRTTRRPDVTKTTTALHHINLLTIPPQLLLHFI